MTTATATNIRTLYDIGSNLAGVLDCIESGELTPEQEARALDAWEAGLGDLREKCAAYIAVIREYESRAAALKEESKRLAERARVAEAHVARMKARAKQALELAQEKAVETRLGKIGLRKAGARPVEWTEAFPPTADELPAEYVRVKKEIDKTAIAADLKAGKVLGFARLGEPTTYVAIS